MALFGCCVCVLGSTNSMLLFGVVSCVGAFVLVVVVIAGWVCARCWCDLWCCDLFGVALGCGLWGGLYCGCSAYFTCLRRIVFDWWLCGLLLRLVVCGLWFVGACLAWDCSIWFG